MSFVNMSSKNEYENMSSKNEYEKFIEENLPSSFSDFHKLLPSNSNFIFISERSWNDFFDDYSDLKINKIYNPLTLKGDQSFHIDLYKSLKGDIYVFSISRKKGKEELLGYTTPENFFPVKFFCNNVEPQISEK